MTTDPDRDDHVLEQNLTTLLRGSDPAAPSDVARARMRNRLVARHSKTATKRSPVMLAGWGLVAAAAGAMVIANVAGSGGGGAGKTAVAPTTPSPDGPPPPLRLADGTTAELGAGGKLTELGPRKVKIEGSVLLDVAPGQGTFQVVTSQGELSVLGTRFLVEAVADRTVTSVLRGVVALRSGGQEEVLHAGEQGEMRKGVRPTRGPAPRLSHLVSWVAERRRRDERPDSGPMRSGALVARNPQWPEQEYPLPMAALTLDVHLENQVARVALDQTFHNPQDQTLEGVYKFALPPGAAVSRLAMYVDGRLQESAVVERMAARRIYEDIVYQRRDPALLEQMGASLVSMRIFPLPPHQDKRVVLAYTQPLARTYDDLTLTVPLPELDQPVGEVAMQLKVIGCASCEITSPSHTVEVRAAAGDAMVSYRASQAKLGDSLVLRVRQPAPAVAVASTIANAQRYLLVRARPTVAAAAVTERPKKWVILDDTSASRGPTELRAQAELIDQLINDIDERDQVMVVAFDATHRRFGTWQDAMTIDRRALATFLAKDAGLGETDLGQALAGAVTLLDGQPGYVVYVGDGTATGERRTIDELRDAVAGKATFIGLGVGDGADLTTLGALADATGGVATTIDLGDDLAWRALDLVASLYTTRITGLTATVDGVSTDAMPLLRSRQVAAGEDIELVVRAPARDDVTAITLRGQAGGQPWTQTIDVGSAARAPGDGGYLPRLWAQRRLEALMTAGDRALAPCVSQPCPTDEERAIAAYHARKREMVALGTEHFLLSQHTSLIVLENDAMYAEYGVTQGSGATWAPYALPKTIPTAPIAPPPVAKASPQWREPLQWRYGMAWGNEEGEAGGAVDVLGARGLALGKVGTLGHGVADGILGGTIGNGSGTGQGYGTGFGGIGFGRSGVGRGGGGTRAAEAKKSAPTEESTPADSSASAGPMADALDDNARLADPSPPPPPAAAAATGGAAMGFDADGDNKDGYKASDRAESAADKGKFDLDAPAQPTGATATAAPAPMTVPAAEPDAAASVTKPSRPMPSSTETMRARRAVDEVVAGQLAQRQQRISLENQRWGGGDWDGRGWNAGGRLMPIALVSSGDWRLDDLTLWLPGLVRGDYDVAADALTAPVGAGKGSITTDAADELRRARATLRPGRWQWGDEAEVTVDASGRLAVRRTLDTGIEEVVRYDGTTLRHRYPQLGIGASRLVGDREPALLATLVPLVPPRPEHLAAFYRVTRTADRQLVLAPVAGGASLRMTLTADGVIGELAVIDGADVTVALTATRRGDGWAVTTAGRTLVARFTADAAATVDPAPPVTVDLELPAAPLALAQQQAAAATAGTPAWRHLQHQRAAAALATEQPGEVAAVATALVTAGALDPAELALVSGGARWIVAAQLRAAIGSNTGAVVDHLRTTSNRGGAELTRLATTDGPIGLIAAHRQVLLAVERNDRKAALTAVRALADRGRGDLLRTIAGVRVATAFVWEDAAALGALDAVAAGRYRNLVRQEAAGLALYRGRNGDTAERWIALMTDVDLAALPPTVDYQAYSAIVNSARGALGWTQAMTSWRQRVLTSDRLDQILAFLRAAAVVPGDDLDAAIDRAQALAGDDVGVFATLYATSLGAGRSTKAQALLDGALAKRPNEPALLRLASAGAELSGDASRAASLLDRAMAGEADRPVSLTQLRGDYTRLLNLHAQLARAASGAARDTEVAAALAVSRDWRAMDPDNADRERQLAELLLAVGNDEEAWRYLSSPIDRAPREGTSFQGAAEVLERAGKLEPARGLWRRAFAIDATNPTWLQRQAMTELAMGQKDAARATVQKILDRRWHVRWDGVTWWAQNAKRSL